MDELNGRVGDSTCRRGRLGDPTYLKRDCLTGRLGDPTYLKRDSSESRFTSAEDLGGGFSCGFVGAGLARGVGDVSVAGEFAEAVGCGDAGLGCDHVCADFCNLFEGFEKLLGLRGFEVVEEFGWREFEVDAEIREVERAVEEGVEEVGLDDVVGEYVGLGGVVWGGLFGWVCWLCCVPW